MKNALLLLAFMFSLSFGSLRAQTSLTPAVQRLFNKIESDILSSAEAMPESRYDFTPADLKIRGSDFKGVRSFAGQILHLATDNILIWSAVTGDSVRSDIPDVNGPRNLKTKKEILDYLRSSFAIGRKAMATLTDKNAMEILTYQWRKLPRLDLVFYALTHANEHYGQMALYLRMCGIIPPPTNRDK